MFLKGEKRACTDMQQSQKGCTNTPREAWEARAGRRRAGCAADGGGARRAGRHVGRALPGRVDGHVRDARPLGQARLQRAEAAGRAEELHVRLLVHVPARKGRRASGTRNPALTTTLWTSRTPSGTRTCARGRRASGTRNPALPPTLRTSRRPSGRRTCARGRRASGTRNPALTTTLRTSRTPSGRRPCARSRAPWHTKPGPTPYHEDFTYAFW